MKKKLLTLIAMFFIVCTCVFTGCTCSEEGLKDNPATDANVVSNGGMTVVKGDYLYYVNGFVEPDTLANDDNKFGEVSMGAIYRTKLVNGDIKKDKDGFVENTEVVVPKVVGYGNGGFYIIDDYIFYGTPYMRLTSDGKPQRDRVEFHRINIDGTSDEIVYVATDTEDNLNWTIYKIDQTPYIVINYPSASKIDVVNTCDTSKVTEVENVTSCAIVKVENYKSCFTPTNLQKYVYFTRAFTAEDGVNSSYKGNAVCSINIATGEVATLELSQNYTYTFKYADKDSIYYTKQNSAISGSLTLLYKKAIDTTFVSSDENKLTNVAYNAYYFCDFGDNLVLATTSDATWIIENGTSTQIATSVRNILGVFGGYAYYVDSNVLYRFDVRGEIVNNSIEGVRACDDTFTYKLDNSNYIDFDNKRIYVFRKYGEDDTAQYLNYINETDLTQRFVGVFEDVHLPAIPEQKDGYGEDEDVKYVPQID